MAVAYQTHQIASWQDLASGGTLTITKPTGLAVGDLMVAHLSGVIASGSNGDWSTPSGWTSLVNVNESTNGNSEARLTVFYKVADSSDVAASNFSFTTNTASMLVCGAIYRISGYASILGSADGASSTTSPTYTNTVTPRADSLLLFLLTVGDAGMSGGSATSYAITTSNPTWTEAYDSFGSSSPRFGLMTGAYASRSAATATGDSTCAITATGSSAQNSVGAIIAIEPPLDVSLSMPVGTVTLTGLAPTLEIGIALQMPVGTLAVGGQAPTVETETKTVWTNETKPNTTWTNETL